MIFHHIPESTEKTLFIKQFKNELLPFCFTYTNSKVLATIHIPQMLCAASCDAAYSFIQEKWAIQYFQVSGVKNTYVCEWEIHDLEALNTLDTIMNTEAILFDNVVYASSHCKLAAEKYMYRKSYYQISDGLRVLINQKEEKTTVIFEAKDRNGVWVLDMKTNEKHQKPFSQYINSNTGNIEISHSEYDAVMDIFNHDISKKIIHSKIYTRYSNSDFSLKDTKYGLFVTDFDL